MPAWDTAGNNVMGAAFLGTTSAQPLRIRTNTGTAGQNFDKMIITTDGNVGIGTGTTPPGATGARLTVAGGGATVNGVAVGTDVTPGINYPFEYETVGVTQTNYNLRLQSPNGIIFHTGGAAPAERMSIAGGGNVGIGTPGAPAGKLDVRGDIRAGNSDIYFTEPNHNHTGIGNTAGFAAIENAASPYDALMILGRAGTTRGRMVRLWDYLQVNGGFDVTGDIALAGKHALRGTDPWLRLNQDGNFTAGVHTPGVFAPGSLNVGGVSGWGNPGSGNAWIAGNLTAENAVTGKSLGQWAPAVFGQNLGPNGIGVLGRDDSPSGGLAGYFRGNTEVEGNFRVLGGFAKNFRIDHPLAPAEKYLDHTCVESSERKNVYDGVERLDEDGSAWVELPEWFEALNKDFRYQLTAIGSAAPELYVAEEISDNRFRIAGGEAEMKVCWQVSGIRSDPGAEVNPMVVEEDKPEEERGRYIRPELYGAPEEQRITREEPITEALLNGS